jgi:hypothetical protein
MAKMGSRPSMVSVWRASPSGHHTWRMLYGVSPNRGSSLTSAAFTCCVRSLARGSGLGVFFRPCAALVAGRLLLGTQPAFRILRYCYLTAAGDKRQGDRHFEISFGIGGYRG